MPFQRVREFKVSNNMEILHFLADGRVGGPHVRIARVHEGMQSANRKITTVVACPPIQPPYFFESRGIEHKEFIWHKPMRESPILSGMRWLTRGMLADVASCRSLIRQHRGALIHINGAILIAAAIAAALERVPWIWHLNDVTVPRILVPLVRLLLLLGKGRAIATSRAVIHHYQLPESTPIVYPPVPLENVVRPSVESSFFRIGTMANLSPGKGIEDIIRAFALVHPTHPQMSLCIAGRVLSNKGWYYEELQKLAETLNVADRVEFLGFVEDPLKWLRSLDLFLFASRYESASVALIEAMACELPIICMDIPATREILGDCGKLVPLGDVRAMAGAIQEIVANQEQRQRMGTAAAERVKERFSDTVVAHQYFKIYSELTGGDL
ncbi:MAG: glycosyltransferase family 1 protein [Methanobacteriota archaeon]|nr:MAG: glycosyltransferase family 1 protein [Euryarchaeota archaeon]